MGIWDEIGKIVCAVTMSISGELATRATNSDNKKLVGKYFYKAGISKIGPTIIELLLNLKNDDIADIIKSVYKFALVILDLLPKLYFFEPMGLEYQIKWYLSHLLYSLSKSLIGIIGKPGGKPWLIISALAGAGFGFLTYLAFTTK